MLESINMGKYIPRKISSELQLRLRKSAVVALVGPRQSGKSTLARLLGADHYFDLENPSDLNRLNDPLLALESLRGRIVIDEIQRKPNLFPILRVLVDRSARQRYLILGSASRDLLQQSSETLAGRISYLYLGGFSLEEIPRAQIDRLWLRGGLPRSFLAKSDNDSVRWRADYVTTYVERDLPNLGIRIPPTSMRRFWTMLAHYHGRLLNYAELGQSFGLSDVAIRGYVETLAGTFMIRVIPPWFENLGKRLIRRPKIYFRDTGLLHSLLAIHSQKDLLSHPILGFSWEGFTLENLAFELQLRDEEIYFYGAHGGGELDLFFLRRGKRWGVEIKYASVPKRTTQMDHMITDLGLKKLYVVYAGHERFPLSKKIEAVPLSQLQSLRKDFGAE